MSLGCIGRSLTFTDRAARPADGSLDADTLIYRPKAKADPRVRLSLRILKSSQFNSPVAPSTLGALRRKIKLANVKNTHLCRLIDLIGAPWAGPSYWRLGRFCLSLDFRPAGPGLSGNGHLFDFGRLR